MRWLIDYIRSCFCKHEWEKLHETKVYSNTDYFGRTIEPVYIGNKWTYRCKKCGYFKTYNDYK